MTSKWSLKPTPKLQETDLAKMVIEFLAEQDWEIYQEVCCGSGRCDIVAKREHILWALECKISFGLAVLEQAARWRHRANYVSIAVSKTPSEFGRNICDDLGIGILTPYHHNNTIGEVGKPKLFRKIKNSFELEEEHKWFCEAGSNSGNYWTPFKKTVRELIRVVTDQPGIEFNKLIKTVDHHYSSYSTAKSCLRGFIGDVIPELRTEIVDRKLCVFPAETNS